MLDFELRDGTALDLLDDRQALEAARRPAVIVVTIHTSLLRDRCLDAGVSYFYSKADDWEELLEVVTSLAAG